MGTAQSRKNDKRKEIQIKVMSRETEEEEGEKRKIREIKKDVLSENERRKYSKMVHHVCKLLKDMG